MTATVLQQALNWLADGDAVAIATVVSTSGSVPGRVGARLAIRNCSFETLSDEPNSFEFEFIGTVGGAGLEWKVLQEAKSLLDSAIENSRPQGGIHTFGLNKGAKGYEVQPLDSLCGGRVTLAIEVILPMPHILLMGCGHCGQAIADLAQPLGWDISVQDTREEFANFELYPSARECHAGLVEDFLAGETGETLSRFSDVLLLGHDWAEDQERLIGMLTMIRDSSRQPDGQSGPRFGVIGSRSKWQSFVKVCVAAGLDEEMINKVRCPIGLNIGADSPEEIAVAVIGEIMALHKAQNPKAQNWREKLDSM